MPGKKVPNIFPQMMVSEKWWWIPIGSNPLKNHQTTNPNWKGEIVQICHTWNPKQPFINGCFNWMIPNLYIGNGCFTKPSFFNICLGFQVHLLHCPQNFSPNRAIWWSQCFDNFCTQIYWWKKIHPIFPDKKRLGFGRHVGLLSWLTCHIWQTSWINPNSWDVQ